MASNKIHVYISLIRAYKSENLLFFFGILEFLYYKMYLLRIASKSKIFSELNYIKKNNKNNFFCSKTSKAQIVQFTKLITIIYCKSSESSNGWLSGNELQFLSFQIDYHLIITS